MGEILHLGIDDTDSPRMGCTTYVAALLVEKLGRLVSFLDYPNIIRLNPNVPWKTRGNGALCLRISVDNNQLDRVKAMVIETIENNSDMSHPDTDPAVVFYPGKVTPDIAKFAKNTIQDIVTLDEALKLIKKHSAEAIGFKKGRGIIGALAAAGEQLLCDHTFELIAYRIPKNCGTPRKVDSTSVDEMNQQTANMTFNNIDPETGRVLITPRGPDPILYGVRGENPEILKKAQKMIRANEKIERWVIFRTNHGTDAHLKSVQTLNQIKPYRPVIARGIVSTSPHSIPGRHIIFTIEDETGQIDCATYEPTGSFRNIIRQLTKGDLVEVYGGVRPAAPNHPITINLEKIKILKLIPQIIYQNPLCPKCKKRMKSMGRDKGFRCDKCGARFPKAKKITLAVQRNLKEELYIPPPRAHRHLTKPNSRYGKERTGRSLKFSEPWHNS